MARFDFQITDADMGRVLAPADGFLVNLMRTKAGVFDPPQWDPGRQCWKNGRFVLRGSGDFKDAVCIDTASGAGWAGHFTGGDSVLANASISYAGDLIVVCVQKGSVWTLTLSDVPVDRTLLRTPANLAEAGQALVAQILKEQALIREPLVVRR
jgi:hypothetical protein